MSPQEAMQAIHEQRRKAAEHRAESARIIAECHKNRRMLQMKKWERIAAIRKEFEGI